MNGLTFYICVGRYAGFRLYWDGGPRVCFGWISFAILLCDLERMMGEVLKALQEKNP